MAQREDLARDRAVVVLALVFAARHPGIERLLAQVAPIREGQERHDQRAAQRDRPALRPASLLRGGARCGAHGSRQARQVALLGQPQRPARFVVQHVLRERGLQFGETLDDRGQSLLLRGRQPGAGAHEVEVHALEQAPRLSAQAERVAPRMQRVDAREQRGVQVDRAVVRGQPRRHHAFDRLQFARRLGAAEVMKQMADAGQQPAARIKGGDRVLERRYIGLGRESFDFGVVLRERNFERRCEMLRPDFAEGRKSIRGLPFLKKGIVGIHRAPLEWSQRYRRSADTAIGASAIS